MCVTDRGGEQTRLHRGCRGRRLLRVAHTSARVLSEDAGTTRSCRTPALPSRLPSTRLLSKQSPLESRPWLGDPAVAQRCLGLPATACLASLMPEVSLASLADADRRGVSDLALRKGALGVRSVSCRMYEVLGGQWFGLLDRGRYGCRIFATSEAIAPAARGRGSLTAQHAVRSVHTRAARIVAASTPAARCSHASVLHDILKYIRIAPLSGDSQTCACVGLCGTRRRPNATDTSVV